MAGVSVLNRLIQLLQSSPAARWFATKEPRERLVYTALAVFAAVAILWAGVWKPVSDWRTVQANRHGNAITLLGWLRANESRVRATLAQGDDQSGNAVLPTVTRAAESRGIKVGRLQPESGGAVSVTLQDQPFNDVIAWIAELQSTQGVSVVRASIDAQETPGLVNAQLRLQ